MKVEQNNIVLSSSYKQRVMVKKINITHKKWGGKNEKKFISIDGNGVRN